MEDESDDEDDDALRDSNRCEECWNTDHRHGTVASGRRTVAAADGVVAVVAPLVVDPENCPRMFVTGMAVMVKDFDRDDGEVAKDWSVAHVVLLLGRFVRRSPRTDHEDEEDESGRVVAAETKVLRHW